MDVSAEIPRRGPASAFWCAAAAFGALWGTIEITLGSFLHTLRIPFSGAFLSALGVALLVSQRQVFPARGLSLATALVAALCKSLSPGGVVLGPMIGIGCEGLIVELALLAAPRFLGSALLAGALAALWSLLQGLVGQYIFYGATVFDLYVALLKKAGQWLGHGQAGWWLVAALMALVAVIGAAGAAAGWRVGRKAALGLEAP